MRPAADFVTDRLLCVLVPDATMGVSVSQSSATILVIDDEAGVCRTFALVLARAGFRVLTTKDSQEACQLARDQKPALIFCDERLQEVDGYDVLRQIKSDAATAHIPVVMMGGTHADGLQDWAALGAARFLAKPFQIDELLSLARSLIRTEPSASPSAAK